MRRHNDFWEGSNVNVTLGSSDAKSPRVLACFLCAEDLPLRRSRTEKPYCVCNSCGLQIFVRGQAGIARLREITDKQGAVTGAPVATASIAMLAFRRIEHLRKQKLELERQRRFFVSDDDLENAIRAVDRQIAKLSGVLAALSDDIKT